MTLAVVIIIFFAGMILVTRALLMLFTGLVSRMSSKNREVVSKGNRMDNYIYAIILISAIISDIVVMVLASWYRTLFNS